MTVYITEDQTTTYLASRTGEEWILDTGVTIAATGVAFDASGTGTGQSFILKGHLVTDGGPSFRIGMSGVGSLPNTVKFDYLATATSNSVGFQALSGGVSVQNLGVLSSRSTLFELTGSGHSVENVNAMESTEAGAFVVIGDNFLLNNNGGTIRSAGMAVSVTGAGAEINNNAEIRSSAGGGIKIEGQQATVANNNLIAAQLDAVTIIGDDASITNNLDITSVAGNGIHVEGVGLTLENNGVIDAGDHGIWILGDGYDIVNHKQVKATGIGLRLEGSGTVLTQDGIYGRVAVQVDAGAVELTNTNELHSSSRQLAAVIGSDDGLTFTNFASVRAKSDIAVECGNAVDVIDNRGWLDGSVHLGGGDDTFRSDTGQVSGIVFGGGGNDLYVINNSIQVRELRAGGIDTVHSTDSYWLGRNFENLVLLGEDAISGTGNGLANTIDGNAGDNRLSGGGGRDTLHGGAGDDTLTGGSGADIFVLAPGDGIDRVTDFVHGKDRISLVAFDGIESLADVKLHLQVTGSDAILEFQDDRLVILGGADIRFSADDFIF